MAFTNTFHSSARGHSIKNAAKLAKCQRHNSRGYLAWDYSANKIVALVGEPEELSADVRAFIDATFAEAKDRYNEKQKRADRIITESPFDHFNDNQKMDIAAESILQVADQEFWADFRTDEVITRGGKNYVRHSFSPEIKKVMCSIFKKQIEAYEQIYETHSEEILDKARAEKTACEEFIAALEQDKISRFEEIRTGKAKDREEALSTMSEAEQEEYATYAAAVNTLESVKEMRIIERIEARQMHIKVINGTGHFDEYSPHAHAVSVCWADGFKNGLDSRIAKSVVLNRWALEVIQDRLHEIAQEEIDKHPEIFKERELDEKQLGRNVDYSKEQYLRQQLEALKRRAAKMDLELNATMGKIEDRFEDLIEVAVDNVASNSDVYGNIALYLETCPEERLEELEREARESNAHLMPELVDLEPMKNGLDDVIEQINAGKGDVSWQERQALWEQYREMSREFWDSRAKLKDDYDALLMKKYNDRRDAAQLYYDVSRDLRYSRNLFETLYSIILLFVADARRAALTRQINELKDKRSELITNTATFKRFSNAYRDQIKAGQVPSEEYMTMMEKTVRDIDEAIAAQPTKELKEALEYKHYHDKLGFVPYNR